MIDGPFSRWPHALFLMRSLGAVGLQSRRRLAAVCAMTAITVAMLAAADARRILPGVSFGVGIFVLVVATPGAASMLSRAERMGLLDVLRLTGLRDTKMLAIVFWAMVVPTVTLGAMFCVAGLAAGVVTIRQAAGMWVAFGAAAALTCAALSLPQHLRLRAAQALVAITVVSGVVAAAAMQDARFDWTGWPDLWPVLIVVELAALVFLVPALTRTLRRPLPVDGSRQRRRNVLMVSYDVSATLARSLMQSHLRAMWAFGGSMAGVVVVWAAQGLMEAGAAPVIASVAVYAPLAVGVLVIFVECGQDSHTGRLQLLRGAPVSTIESVVCGVGGGSLPFIAGATASGALAWLLLGNAPIHPLVALVVTFMLAPALATEAWMAPAKTHLVGIATAMPALSVMMAADKPWPEWLAITIGVIWIPWLVAAKAFRNPDGVVMSPLAAVCGLAVVSAVVFRNGLVLPITLKPDYGIFGGALLVASPLLGFRQWPMMRVAAPIVVAAVGIAAIAQSHVPWNAGLSAVSIPVVYLLIANLIDDRWAEDKRTALRLTLSYAFTSGMLMSLWYPGREHMSDAQLAVAVTWTTAGIVAVAGASTEVGRIIFRRMGRLS